MTRYKYVILTIILFNILGGCKKGFLDVPDKRAVLRQAYVTDLKTLSEFLNGTYVEMSADFYYGTNLIYPDIVADNIKPATGMPFLGPHYDWMQMPDDYSSVTLFTASNMNPVWLNGIRISRYCSFVTEKAEEYKNEDPVKSEELAAQAYAIRALMHFTLVNTFAQSYVYTTDASHAGIPYIKTSDWTEPITRISVREVYDNIVADLNVAIGKFQSPPNVLQMNKNAAKALLARVLLFKEDFAASRSIAREISTLIPIMKGNDYPSKLFTRQESEAIFQLTPSSTLAAVGGKYDTFFEGRYFNFGPNTFFLATGDIAALLTENSLDVRRQWIKSGGAMSDTIVKFPVAQNSKFNPPSGDYYQTLFRSSEMYLTAAECYFRLNNEDSARYFLDAIKMRANPTATVTLASGAALLDSIMVERRKELAFEGFRMFDLQRWKKPVNRVDASNPAAKTLPYPSDKAIAPIPVQDVKVGGLSQNSGYQ